MVTLSISRKLANFVDDLSCEKLPASVLENAKLRILDAFSTAIAGRDLPVPEVAINFVKGNKGKATLYAHRYRVPAIDAAFVNATLINARSQDDFLQKSHPSALTVPSALAIAEEEGSSGSEVLTAIVAGYDTIARIYLGGPAMLPKFRASGVTGTIGAAVTAGKLLKLNADGLVDAIGCAAMFSSGFGEGFLSGTMDVKLNVGMSSRNGVTAALLARMGATASETSLEGPSGFYRAFSGTTDHCAAATAGLGEKYFMEDVVYKDYPVCIFVQTPLALSRQLAHENNIDAKEIEKVIIRVADSTFTNPGFRNVAPFSTHLQAAVSARFCIAAAFLGKPIESYELYDQLEDREVLEMADRIDLVSEEERESVEIEVVMKSGLTIHKEGIEREILHPSQEKVVAKFKRLASGFLGTKTEKIIDQVLHLERIKKISELTDQLRPDKKG